MFCDCGTPMAYAPMMNQWGCSWGACRHIITDESLYYYLTLWA